MERIRTVRPIASHPSHGFAPWGSRQREIGSAELLGGEREVLIVHDSQVYRLRHTRSGKLILTK